MQNESLKVIFSEVLRGFSLYESEKFGRIKVKHFNNFQRKGLFIKKIKTLTPEQQKDYAEILDC